MLLKEQLKASEEEVASEKEDDDNTQSQLNDLASQLQEAVAARDALNDEKQALADSVNELTERLNGSESGCTDGQMGVRFSTNAFTPSL